MHHKFCFAAYNILMPYPGTPLYARLQAENRLLYGGKWWLHPEYRFNHAAFIPRNMSPDELTEACWQCRRQWNTWGSIFHRIWDFKTVLSSPRRLATYLYYNPIYSREARKKQGMLFGLFRRDPGLRMAAARGPSDKTRPDMPPLASPMQGSHLLPLLAGDDDET
jgi:hypothetical protein